MRTRVLLPFLALVLFAAAAGARAEEPQRYTLPSKELWKAGEVVTKKETKRQTQKQVVKGPDGTLLQEQDAQEVVAYEYVKRVVEVDKDANEARFLVWFKSWSRTSGEVADVSLAGRHVEVVGAPGARTAKVLGTDAKPSAAALAWVESEFAKKSEVDAATVFVPTKPVAVGDSWSPDAALLAKLLGGEKMEMVPDSLRAKLSLVSVDATHGTIKIDIAFQSGELAGPAGKMAWAEGGTFEVRGEGTIPLVATTHSSGGKTQGGLKGTLDAGGGVQVSLDIAFEEETRTTAGGELPAAPGAK